MENFKTVTGFKKIRETEKAVLISAKLPEIEDEAEFWLPKSKCEISKNEIKIDEEIYAEKVKELKEPKSEPKIIVHSKVYDKLEKATKLILDAQLNEEHDFELWLFVPNSQVVFYEPKGELHLVTVPEWIYDSSLKNAISKGIEFFNKDEKIYDEHDVKVMSKIERKI